MNTEAVVYFNKIRKETDKINKKYQINTNNIQIKFQGFSLNDIRL